MINKILILLFAINFFSKNECSFFKEMEKNFDESLKSSSCNAIAMIENKVSSFCNNENFVEAAYYTFFAASKMKYTNAVQACFKSIEFLEQKGKKGSKLYKRTRDILLPILEGSVSDETLKHKFSVVLIKALSIYYCKGYTLYEDAAEVKMRTEELSEEETELCDLVSTDEEGESPYNETIEPYTIFEKQIKKQEETADKQVLQQAGAYKKQKQLQKLDTLSATKHIFKKFRS